MPVIFGTKSVRTPPMLKTLCGVLLLMAILVACRPDPEVAYGTGDILLRETFSEQVIGWDNRSSGAVRIGVESGAYRLRSNVSSYVRGFYRAETYDNVVIDVQGLQFSDHENNAYGVLCRAETGDDRASGYYFLVGGDGSYSIRKGQHDEINGLVKWGRTDVVNQGEATNRLRVVCVDDYLALYVNDTFLADVRDTTYGSGYIGFAVAVEDGETITVSFDNLTILEGVLGD